MSKESELGFKSLLFSKGYTGKAVEELWKWFDSSEKKGVASF
jgi:hypothetical protein